MNPNKLNIHKIRKIFKLRGQGFSLHNIAIEVGITGEAVRNCLKVIIKIVEDYKNKIKK